MIRFKNKMGEFNFFFTLHPRNAHICFLFLWGNVGLAAPKDFSKRCMGFSDSVHRYYSNLTISPKHAPPQNN